MRKKGILILVVIILIVAVVGYFTRDRRIEKMFENIGQSVAGARVEIDNFHFSVLKMECSWNRLQIADKNDPWKNVLEIGRASFDLETRPLFWRRVIVKEMILENVRSGTQRKTDGSIPKKPEPATASTEPGFFQKASASLQKQMGDLPVFDLSGLGKKLKIDSLVDINNLLTVQGYKKLELTADSSFKFWQSQLKTQTYLDRVNQLEQKMKTLKLDEIKDLNSLNNALTSMKDMQKEINSLRDEVGEKHSELTNTFNNLQTNFDNVKNSLKEDIDRAKQLASLKELDVKDVSLLLFGAPIVNQTEKVLGYVAIGRKYLPTVKKLKGTPKEKKPPRFKGQDIRFPFHYRYPKFLLRKAKLSAATAAGDTSRAYFVEGDLIGLTSQPEVYSKPTRFLMDLKKINGNLYEIKGSLDHITEIAHDSLWVSAKNFALGQVKLKKGKYFPSALQAKKGNVQLTGLFIGDNINFKMDVDAAPVEFIFDNPAKDKISQIVREVLMGLNRITLTAEMKGKQGDYKMRMNSNVDQVLANQVKQTIAKNLREAQQQVEDYVRAEADKRRVQVENLINEKRATVYAELDKAKQQVDEKKQEFDNKKKELDERIEQEKKKIEEQAKNKLRDMFKKP